MTVCFVAIGAKTGESGGMDDVALGQVKDRAAPWAAFALWGIVGLLDPTTIMLRILTRTGAFGEPGTSQRLETWRCSCCRPSA